MRHGGRRSIPRASWLRALSAALAFLILAGCTLSCESLGASAIVNAPNRGAPAPATTLAGELRVPVGPPDATLSLEIIDPAVAHGTVFVLHGIRADKEACRGWGEMLARAGFRAVLVDLRGHGRSTGDFLTFGVVESRDLVQVLDALETRGLTLGDVGVLGYSYGGGIGIEWAGIDPRVKAVVAVAPFASLRDVVPGYVSMLPAGFVSGAIDLAGKRGGFDPDEASPVLAMGHTGAPVLLIHGGDDQHVPPWHSRRIFDARPNRTQLLLVAGASHATIVSDPVIAQRVPAWFERYLVGDATHQALVNAPPAAVPQ
jgi:pimeloyl-ACP methyl ester carboxylesterase